ncbi:hypothetical protein [Weissella viridescens]|uniref:hypothetical protein n=1 Tax=Weissella viridescens TaxID=1629 RepID=UPI003AA7DF01
MEEKKIGNYYYIMNDDLYLQLTFTKSGKRQILWTDEICKAMSIRSESYLKWFMQEAFKTDEQIAKERWK